MRKLHKKPLIIATATLALTGTLAVGSAMAYFTTYSTAGGGVKMNMGFTEHQTADGQTAVTATGITMKYFRQKQKPQRNSTSNTQSRQEMTNQKNLTS